MISLHGRSLCKGIAIAEAAVLPPAGGVSDLPHELLERGIGALKRRTPESEMPEIVVLCQSVVDGLALSLPGIRIAAVAAESEDNPSGAPSVPCIAGIEDLLRDANNGDIVIVDGIRGAVYLDPDAETLIHYQSLEDSRKTRRIFLESRHLPAVTQEGKRISVFAVANCSDDIPSSLEEGADGIVLSPAAVKDMSESDWGKYVRLAAGKPLFLLSPPDTDSMRLIMSQSLPGQITVAFPREEERGVARFHEDVEAVVSELLDEGGEPAVPSIAFSIGQSSQVSCTESSSHDSRLIVDAGGCDATTTHDELRRCVREALSAQEPPEDAKVTAIVILGSSIDAVSHIPFEVDTVAVPVGLVGVTKDLIRSFPLDEQL